MLSLMMGGVVDPGNQSGGRHRQPGCPCCCPNCIYFFTGDFSNESSNWSSTSGSWSFGASLTTTSDNALILRESGAPSANHKQVGRTSPMTMSASVAATHYLYFFWEDSSNHLYAKIVFTETDVDGHPESVVWEFREVIDGVDSLLSTKTIAPPSTAFGTVFIDEMRWEVCQEDGDISVWVFTEEQTHEWDFQSCSDYTALGTKQGFGTGSLNGETFKAVVSGAYKLEQYCPCVCDGCEKDSSPAQLQIVLAGIQNTDPEECPDCYSTVNGTFILDRVLSADLSTTSDPINALTDVLIDDDYCKWYYVLSFCTVYNLYIIVDVLNRELYLTSSIANRPAQDEGNVFELDIQRTCEVVDCENDLNGLVVSLSGNLTIFGTDLCDLTGATATITVV